MIDVLDLGPVPCDEQCEQLGPNYNPAVARIECQAYIGQLKRIHGEPPVGAGFKITHNPHDFGTYLDVAVKYSDTEEEAEEWAYKVEDNTPEKWDDLAMMYIDRKLAGLGLQPRFDERLTK